MVINKIIKFFIKYVTKYVILLDIRKQKIHNYFINITNIYKVNQMWVVILLKDKM